MLAPSNLVLKQLTETSVKLGWKLNSTDQLGIRIWKTDDSTWKIFTQIHWSSNPALTEYTDNTVKSKEAWRYKVSCFNAIQQTGLSNEVVVTIPGQPVPLSPSSVYAAPVSSTKIQLNWQINSNNETGFKIYRKKFGESNFVLITTTLSGVNQYNDTVEAQTIYFYAVTAFNVTGESEIFNIAGI